LEYYFYIYCNSYYKNKKNYEHNKYNNNEYNNNNNIDITNNIDNLKLNDNCNINDYNLSIQRYYYFQTLNSIDNLNEIIEFERKRLNQIGSFSPLFLLKKFHQHNQLDSKYKTTRYRFAPTKRYHNRNSIFKSALSSTSSSSTSSFSTTTISASSASVPASSSSSFSTSSSSLLT